MPSKSLPQDMKDLQFCPEQFAPVLDFDAFLQGVIDGQEALLIGRVGQLIFDSTDSVIAALVKQVSISLSTVELLQRRIIRASSNINADSAVLISTLQKAQDGHNRDAEQNIARLVTKGSQSDSTADFAAGIATSSHYDGDFS